MNLSGIIADLGDAVSGDMTPYSQVPTSPEFPCCYVGLPEELSDFASSGSCSLRMPLTVAVSRSDEESAQTQLTDLLTIELVYRIIRKESAHWSDIAFVSINRFRSVTFGNAEALAADINLQLRTT